jgi:hypothetical protein
VPDVGSPTVLAFVFDKFAGPPWMTRVRAWWTGMQLTGAHALLCPVCDIWDDE